MKKAVIALMLMLALLSIAYANEVTFKELENYTLAGEKVISVNVKEYNANENLTVKFDANEISEMNKKGISKIELDMYQLKVKFSLSDIVNKGDIKISSKCKDDLYYLTFFSSKYGNLYTFENDIQVTIPYELEDEEAYHITMYGVDENEQIINLKGFMNEEEQTVSARIKSLRVGFIPVVNKVLYEDLHDYMWAKEFIEEAAAKGILAGKSEGVYAPDENITRAEFVTLLINTLNLELVDKINTFDDIKSSEWYYEYVISADYYGLISGGEENKFLPEETITRQDIVVMVGKALEKFNIPEIEEVEYNFVDEDEIDEYAVPYLEKCLNQNLVSGYEDGTFRPEAYAKRAEAAVIINKLFNKIHND